MASGEARRFFALLANPEARTVLGHLFLGVSLPDALAAVPLKKRAKIEASLRDAGLVSAPESGGVEGLEASAFRAFLAADAPATRTGVERFLRNGRIETYPANLDERGELLAWVAGRLGEGADARLALTESELNEKLSAFHDDVAVLRRYLVDYGLLERAADGSRYSLPR